MSELVDALWVAPYEATLPDNTRLVPGQTTAHISRAEAAASANWQVVEPAATAAKPAQRSTE
jgi:hypothetical protein